MILDGFLFTRLYCFYCQSFTWHIHTYDDTFDCLYCRSTASLILEGEEN